MTVIGESLKPSPKNALGPTVTGPATVRLPPVNTARAELSPSTIGWLTVTGEHCQKDARLRGQADVGARNGHLERAQDRERDHHATDIPHCRHHQKAFHIRLKRDGAGGHG